MERTPEEIKAGLECCIKACDCDNNCPYMLEINCTRVQRQDALAYIQQLEAREWDLFDLLSSAWFGKRCYFRQDDGNVYSRLTGEYMSFDQAIDELAHELTSERECERVGKDINVPRWISVEERLPKNEEPVLIATKWSLMGMRGMAISCGFRTNGKTFTGDSDYNWDSGNVDLLYDEEEDEYIVPECWWESVRYSDEFAAVYEPVLYWMPLPEPPKEGNA